MQVEWSRPRRMGQGSRDGAGRRKLDTIKGVVVFTPSSPFVVIWEGLGVGRVRSTDAREAGKPTGTSSGTLGVTTVAGFRQGI